MAARGASKNRCYTVYHPDEFVEGSSRATQEQQQQLLDEASYSPVAPARQWCCVS